MKNKIAKLFLALIFAAGVFLPLSFAHATTCSSFTNLFNINPSNISTSSVNTVNPATQVTVYCSAGDLLTAVLNILFGFTGAVAVIFIIIGGFQLITSRGNDEQAERGRKTLTNALIGLVVVVLAATIVKIVVSTVTGSTSTSNSSSPNNSINTTVNNASAQSTVLTPVQQQSVGGLNNVNGGQ